MCDAYRFHDRRVLASRIALRQREILAQHTRNGWVDRIPIITAEIDWWQAKEADLLA